MKQTKFILPMIALLSCTSCAGPKIVARHMENGKAPEGGTLITDNAQKKEAVRAAFAKANEAVSNLEEFGLSIKSEGISLELESEHLNGTTTLGSFELKAGASNLFSGNKDNTKIGLTFSGLESTIDMASTGQPDKEDFVMQSTNTVGSFGAYLEKGNVYADLSSFAVADYINKGATLAEPYLPAVLELAGDDVKKGVGPIVTYFVSEFAKSPENVTKTIAPMFGCSPDNFDYKLAFKNALKDSNYPLVTASDIIPEGENAVDEFETSFNNLTGFVFFDDVALYTYAGDALAFELSLGKDKLTTLLDKYIRTDFDYTINDGDLNFALYINEVGIPSLSSVYGDFDLTLTGAEIEARFGESLHVDAHLGLDIEVLSEENPVEFPESYEGYHDLSPLASLATLIKK